MMQLMAWFLVKGALLGVLALIVYVVYNPWHRFRLRHIPGPAYRAIYGNLDQISRHGLHEFMVQCRQRYGPIFKVWAGHKAWVVVCDPDAGKRVNYKLLNRPRGLGDPLLRGPSTEAQNKGLFFSTNDHWRKLHRVWQPVFYADSVRACAPLMDTTTQRMLERLEGLATAGQPLDIWREIGKLTMAIVGTAAYGIDFHTLDAEGDTGAQGAAATRSRPALSLRDRLRGSFANIEDKSGQVALGERETGARLIGAAKVLFASAGRSTLTGSIYHSMALLAPSALTAAINFMAHAWPDAAFQRVLEARMILGSASLALVRQARAAAQQQEQVEGEAASPSAAAASGKAVVDTGFFQRPKGSVAPGSFLDLLLSARDKAGAGLSDLQMLMQANTFTLAGYETTANTLAFSLFCLATHPEAEAKVVEEIRAVAAAEAARKDTAATAGEPFVPWHSRDLEQQFPWLCATVMEALRLYPPGASTLRETPDTPFAVGPYTLPPRSTVFVGTYVMQRDPELWPHADAFKPERWLPGYEHLAAKNPAAYLPFGSGGRMCIGQRFALQEVRLGLVQLMQRFHFDVDWSLMPAADSSGSTKASSNSDGDGGDKPRALKTTMAFTLSPAEGIWVRLSPRPCPPGASLL